MPPRDPSSDTSVAGKLASEAEYTWEEVAKHNTPQSAWIYYEDSVYDITKFAKQHPGGEELIRLAAGRDATYLIPSYHPFQLDKVETIMKKYRVGKIKTTEFPRFAPDSRGFYTELRQEAAKYFESTGKDYKDPRPGLIRLFFFLIGFAFTWVYCMNPANPMLWRSVAAALFGVFQALPLLHVMHDSSHTSLGHSQWWWTIVGKGSFDLLAGGSLNSWIHQHVLGHHLYTNVITVDPDLPAEFEGDVRRVMDRQSYSWIYALQWIYLPILYGVLAIKFRIQDIQLLFSHMNGAVRVNKIPTAEWVRQFAAKALVITWRVLVPIFMWELPVKHVLLLNLLAEYMTGIYLTYNFQVSHVSPQLIWPDVNKPQFDLCWAETQVATTVDYAHDNTITTLLCGALNYQTIHHLFPAVSQYHYPALAPIVKRVCKKHGVKFNYLPDFTTAFLAHLRQLWIMGWNRVAEHMD